MLWQTVRREMLRKMLFHKRRKKSKACAGLKLLRRIRAFKHAELGVVPAGGVSKSIQESRYLLENHGKMLA